MAGQPGLCAGHRVARLALRRLRSQGDSFKSAMMMITALRRLYENHHSDDLTALKKLYQHYAEDCVRMAALTFDSQRAWSISYWQAGGPKQPPRLAHRSTKSEKLTIWSG